MIIADVVKVVVPAVLSFIVGIAITPTIAHYLYKYKAWKKKSTSVTVDGKPAPISQKLHNDENKKTPRMGGVVIWGSVIITIAGTALIALFLPSTATIKLDFLSRGQTWIPLVTLMGGALVGLVDDLLVIRPKAEGLPLSNRLLVVVVLASFIGWWFWEKLDVVSVGIPFAQPLEIGWLVIPLFVLVSLALYASGVIDGIDGLAGGVFASVFASYAIIAFAQSQIDLAAFSAAVVGGILAFLWFNIPPARFYMSDTGTMALTLTIAVLAFMTDTLGDGIGIAVLPIIGGLLVATVGSVILQVYVWKKFFGRKMLIVTPLHNHFQAIGWAGHKVTMRYWVLSIIFASAGVILALIAA
jgi:phospho-N-acetylmuramoyl-pentapeptide-transferase